MYVDEKVTEKTLKALGLVELPPKNNTEQIWVFGLCLVEKTNGRSEYVVVRHDIDDNDVETMTVYRDYGSMCSISKMGEVLPYEYVSQTPELQIKTGADVAKYLAKAHNTAVETFKGMPKAKLMVKFKKEMIKTHLKNNGFSNGK